MRDNKSKQRSMLRGVHPLSPSGFPLRPIDPARQLNGASFSFGKAPLRTTAAFWRDVPRYFIFIVGTPVSRQQKPPTGLADSSINASKDRPRPFTRVTAARAGGVAPNKTKRPPCPVCTSLEVVLVMPTPPPNSPRFYTVACDNTVRSHSLQEKRRSLQSINDWNNANETDTKSKKKSFALLPRCLNSPALRFGAAWKRRCESHAHHQSRIRLPKDRHSPGTASAKTWRRRRHTIVGWLFCSSEICLSPFEWERRRGHASKRGVVLSTFLALTFGVRQCGNNLTFPNHVMNGAVLWIDVDGARARTHQQTHQAHTSPGRTASKQNGIVLLSTKKFKPRAVALRAGPR